MRFMKLAQQLLDALWVDRPWRPGHIHGGKGQLPKRIKRATSDSRAGIGQRTETSRPSNAPSTNPISESIDARDPGGKQMWEQIPHLGYFMSSVRMSDVTASYIMSGFQYELDLLKDIGIAAAPNRLSEELDIHRKLNIDMMRSVAHQVPKGLRADSPLCFDMENLPSIVESAGLRLPACATLGTMSGEQQSRRRISPGRSSQDLARGTPTSSKRFRSCCGPTRGNGCGERAT